MAAVEAHHLGRVVRMSAVRLADRSAADGAPGLLVKDGGPGRGSGVSCHSAASASSGLTLA
jgi:hypothetical protein